MKKLFRGGVFWMFLLPSLLGMLAFYFIPFLASLYYAAQDAGTGGFAGLSNFIEVLGSQSFQTGLKNTGVFMLICVPLNMALPFMLAYILNKHKKKSIFMLAFMLPLIIPSGVTVYFWRVIFDEYGLMNNILHNLGMNPVHFFQSGSALIVIIFAFMCKNLGFDMVLFIAGLNYIPKEYYELAAVEGCGRTATMRRVTLVYLMPTTFIVLLMSIINSFKIFREIYLLFGNYPSKSVYMLQHFMNNLFSAASLQKLSAASTVISAVIIVIVSGLFIAQKRLSDSL